MLVGFEFISKILEVQPEQEGSFLTVIVPLKPSFWSFYLLLPPSGGDTGPILSLNKNFRRDCATVLCHIVCVLSCKSFDALHLVKIDEMTLWEGVLRGDVTSLVAILPSNPHTHSHMSQNEEEEKIKEEKILLTRKNTLTRVKIKTLPEAQQTQGISL